MLNRNYFKNSVGVAMRVKAVQMSIKQCPLLLEVTTPGRKDAQASSFRKKSDLSMYSVPA